jgi:hypothetical protein
MQNDNLFNQSGEYLGWIENGEVYDRNRIYRGEVYNNDYAVRNINKTLPNKIARIPAMNIIPPMPPINRIGNIGMMMGYSEIE